MKTVALILEAAAPVLAGCHITIKNDPWQELVIEDIQQPGPRGLPTVSVAHYGEQNGDLMRDPEMLFEVEKMADEIRLTPYYWRNDYVGVEEYSAIEQAGGWITLPVVQRKHVEFADAWDKNLEAQGYLEAFLRQRENPLNA